MRQDYKEQVELLLEILPEVAKQSCFALHGGTAINFFVRDMPRLSVDIDLTYIPLEDRNTSLNNINQGLNRIKTGIESKKGGIQAVHQQNVCKLFISRSGAQIKIEVNMINRGVLAPPEQLELCQSAQSEFDAFCAMYLVPTSQLYGGKICAALDRQHPRDFFDLNPLMDQRGFFNDIKHGFLYSLLCSDRPIYELLAPRLQDQRGIFENQFEGMSREPFSYEEYQEVRSTLVRMINASLTDEDKNFLLRADNVEPDWGLYAFEQFPAVQWKLQNLKKLRDTNPNKHRKQHELLADVLSEPSSKPIDSYL